MERYVEFIWRNAKKVMVILIVANIVAFFGLLRLRINPDFRVFMPKNSKQIHLYEKMTKDFGSGDQIALVIEFDSDPMNINSLNHLKEIEKNLESLRSVEAVVGPVPKVVPSGFLKLEKVEKITEGNLKRVVDFIESNPVGKSILELDGKYYALFSVFPKEDVKARDLVHEIESSLKKENFFLSGNLYVQAKLFDYIILVLFTLPPAAVFLMFFVFRWVIRDSKATFLAILPAGIGALWVMGTMGWILGEITIVTVLVPIFTVIMGSADGLHFISHYLEKLSEGDEKRALIETLKTIGTAMIMTTLTTMAGFLSLLTIDSEALKQMGLFSSLGIGLAGIATWTFLPTVLVLSNLQNFERSSLDLRLKVPKRMGILAPIILILIFLPGLGMMRTDFSMVSMYKSFTRVRKNVEKVRDIFKIYMPVFAICESKADPVSPEFASNVLDYEKSLRNSKKVLKVISYYDIASFVYEKLYGLEKPIYPENFARANLVYSLIRRNDPETVGSLILRSKKLGRILISPSDLKSDTLDEIEKITKSRSFKITGIPYVIKEMNDNIISQQIKSMIFALSLVFAMLLVTMRSLKLALLSVVPITSTLVILFGFMGYVGIDLSLVTVNMAAITIGVGIDYAIHYVALYKKYNSAKLALEGASKPILANALGLAIGFTVMNLSPFTFHTYLSAIMWVTMISSSLLSLAFLSSVLERSDQ